MPTDSSNLVRVDIEEVFLECRRISQHKSQALDGGKTYNQIAIEEDEHDDIYNFFMEGAAKIADACNYVTTVDQDGLDALTRTEPNEVDEKSVIAAEEYEKFTGEALDPDEKTVMEFNVPGLVDFYKNTIIQQYIKEALTYYILYKWYDMKHFIEIAEVQKSRYEEALGKCRFNSITNTKRKKVKRPSRFY